MAQIQVSGVGVNRNTVNVLHHEVGPAIAGVSGVQQASDGGMIEVREELALPEKTVAPRGPLRASAKELDGDLLLNLAVAALAEIHVSHAARAQQPDQPVRSARTEFAAL